MKYLVTGSSGFLGRHFVEALTREEDADVWMIDLVQRPGVPHDVGDVVDYLAELGDNVDVVYHFAAPVGGRRKIEGDPFYNADSLRIDEAVFRWARDHADTILFPSSSAVYPARLQGHLAGRVTLLEDDFDPAKDLWGAPDEMYGFTKLVGEVLAWKSAAFGLNALCIRPFSGYGPGQSFDYPVPSIARRALNREYPLQVWGEGTQSRDFVHVSDLVAATQARLKAGVKGYQAMNIATGIATSFIEVAETCASIVGYTPRIQPTGVSSLTPQGVYHRVGDTFLMNQYHTPQVSLRDGLESVIVELMTRA